MKKNVLKLIDAHIGIAQDNAYRAQKQFGGRSPECMDKEYGQSMRKCKDILAEYESALAEAIAMKIWFMANSPRG